MKCRILKPLKANGEKELNPGDIVDVPKNLAIKYIEKGKIIPTEKVAYRIYSNILQAYLWVVADNNDREAVRASQDVTEAIYSHDEIKELKGLNKDSLIEIHKVKEVFEQSKVMECKKKNEKL